MTDNNTAPSFPDFTYSYHILATPSKAVEESDQHIPYAEDDISHKVHIEGPITKEAFTKATKAASEAFQKTLDDELSDHDLDEFTITEENDE